jgi:hypothetical protein
MLFYNIPGYADHVVLAGVIQTILSGVTLCTTHSESIIRNNIIMYEI